jgi:hypothetical protein
MLFVLQITADIWCALDSRRLDPIILMVIKHLNTFWWDVFSLCVEFSQKTSNHSRFKQSSTPKREKDCAAGETIGGANISCLKTPSYRISRFPEKFDINVVHILARKRKLMFVKATTR